MKYKHFKKLLKNNNVATPSIWWRFIYTNLGVKDNIYLDDLKEVMRLNWAKKGSYVDSTHLLKLVKDFEWRFDYIGNEVEKDNPRIVAKFIDKTQGAVHYLLDNENRYKEL